MGLPWMTRDELAQAICPDYTEYIARQIVDLFTCSAALLGSLRTARDGRFGWCSRRGRSREQ